MPRRNPNTDAPQPTEPELPPTAPDSDDPTQPAEPLPLPPDTNTTPDAPVREPDTPAPMGDPKPNEPTRLM